MSTAIEKLTNLSWERIDRAIAERVQRFKNLDAPYSPMRDVATAFYLVTQFRLQLLPLPFSSKWKVIGRKKSSRNIEVIDFRPLTAICLCVLKMHDIDITEFKL